MKEADHIYVVSKGSYSDYRVVCACPTKGDAERVAYKLRSDPDGWSEDARVETLPVITGDVEKEELYYFTTTLWDDGRETNKGQSTRSDWPMDTIDEHLPVVWRWVRAPMHHDKGGRLDVHGTDRDRAAKVFSEKRAQLKADAALSRKGEWKGRITK